MYYWIFFVFFFLYSWIFFFCSFFPEVESSFLHPAIVVLKKTIAETKLAQMNFISIVFQFFNFKVSIAWLPKIYAINLNLRSKLPNSLMYSNKEKKKNIFSFKVLNYKSLLMFNYLEKKNTLQKTFFQKQLFTCRFKSTLKPLHDSRGVLFLDLRLVLQIRKFAAHIDKPTHIQYNNNKLISTSVIINFNEGMRQQSFDPLHILVAA